MLTNLLKLIGNIFLKCPDSSVVERIHGKDEVTGSSPVLGSIAQKTTLCYYNSDEQKII